MRRGERQIKRELKPCSGDIVNTQTTEEEIAGTGVSIHCILHPNRIDVPPTLTIISREQKGLC